jgi:DNA-binding IscR family transcriptional regulator
MRLNVCLNSDRACARQEWCPAHDVWSKAQAAVAEVLRTANIAELARQAAVRKPALALTTPEWN